LSDAYDPKAYWEERLAAHGGLRGVGHISFGASYNRWLYRAKRRTLESALHDVPLTGKSVLDIGSGTGYFVQWYVEHGARVSGIDITQSSIDRLRQRFPGHFRVIDISAADAPHPGEHDIVNAWDVMYHVVGQEAFERALRYLAAGVRSGGLLMLTDMLGAPTDRQAAPHVCMRSLDTYRSRLAPLGFELVGLHFLYRWLNRYVSIPLIDSRLGALFYWLDGRNPRIPADNLSLGVWRRMASS
jgi:2-polyprenyl-3-methyl-5-hydroxy-6-metoxy-1,4-benzoquinol methylase